MKTSTLVVGIVSISLLSMAAIREAAAACNGKASFWTAGCPDSCSINADCDPYHTESPECDYCGTAKEGGANIDCQQTDPYSVTSVDYKNGTCGNGVCGGGTQTGSSTYNCYKTSAADGCTLDDEGNGCVKH